MQTCGQTTGAPRRRPAAIRTEVLSIFKPTEDNGSAWSHLLTVENTNQEAVLYQLGQ